MHIIAYHDYLPPSLTPCQCELLLLASANTRSLRPMAPDILYYWVSPQLPYSSMLACNSLPEILRELAMMTQLFGSE